MFSKIAEVLFLVIMALVAIFIAMLMTWFGLTVFN